MYVNISINQPCVALPAPQVWGESSIFAVQSPPVLGDLGGRNKTLATDLRKLCNI